MTTPQQERSQATYTVEDRRRMLDSVLDQTVEECSDSDASSKLDKNRPVGISRMGPGSRTDTARQAEEELDEALLKLTMLDDVQLDNDTNGTQAEEGDSWSEGRPDPMQNLEERFLERSRQMKLLQSAFEDRCDKEHRVRERVRELECIVAAGENQGWMATASKGRMATMESRPSSKGRDPVILEKLNLAYEDLAAIYDLRVDIDHQLTQLHEGLVDPSDKKQIIKLIRDKELQLHKKRQSK